MSVSRRLMIGLLVAAFTCPVLAEKPTSGELTQQNYEAWRDHVLPQGWELKYEKIGWRTSYWSAIIEAQEKDMPILFWAMNGHPLCNV